MHTKQTVKYICHHYPSGNCYYYKSEIITHLSWDCLDSLQWSTPRPITERTFLKRRKQGYKVEFVYQTKQPAVIVPIR
ncbi:hypothetical protein [Halalkalibacter sp. APA_J-10(15)]|uniref:hypothetical protein n=1 Tax=unclassified Halalkalibacter TaxID=2893063 RepID=UPI001FF2EEC4|nr:hypothetical protein [Halalkalibacter sp. APA_J-10(15)]MCK0471466.1 hypothetical protein [Halalkalibacter sp. APA_J-10(15)]